MTRLISCTLLAAWLLCAPAAHGQESKTLLTLEDEPKSGDCLWIALSPDGKLLAFNGTDEVVRVRELSSGKVVQKIKRDTLVNRSAPFGLAFSPDSKTLVYYDYDALRAVSIPDGKPVKLTKFVYMPRCLVFTPDSTRVASRHANNGLKSFDIKTGKQADLPLWEVTHDILRDRDQIAFSADGKWLAQNAYFTNNESTIAVRLLDDDKAKWIALKGHKGTILALTFSADGKTLTSAASDKTIRVWDIKSGKEQGKVEAPGLANLEGGIVTDHAAIFSPDGSLLLAVSNEKKATVTITEVKTGKTLATAKEEGVRIAGFLPDNKTAIYMLPGFNGLDGQRPTIVRKLEVPGAK